MCTVTVVANGSSYGWYVVSSGLGSKSFSKSLSVNGYQKLPSGIIIQWGRATHPGNNTALQVNYPIAFPGGMFAISGSELGATPTINYSMVPLSNSYFSLTSSYMSGTNTCGWIAIGY